MAFVKINSIDGRTQEFQVVDMFKDIQISVGLAKFRTMDDIIEENTPGPPEPEIIDENEVSPDYFYSKDLYEVFNDNYDLDDLKHFILNLIRSGYYNKDQKKLIVNDLRDAIKEYESDVSNEESK